MKFAWCTADCDAAGNPLGVRDCPEWAVAAVVITPAEVPDEAEATTETATLAHRNARILVGSSHGLTALVCWFLRQAQRSWVGSALVVWRLGWWGVWECWLLEFMAVGEAGQTEPWTREVAR